MKKEFNQLEILINRLTLHSLDRPADIGLLYGQMGYVLALAKIAQTQGLPPLDKIADRVCDNVFARAGSLHNISIGNGLAGIGWGVEYLIQEELLDGNGNDYCTEIDNEIMKTDIARISDLSLETGLYGLCLYVMARISGNIKAGLELPFDEAYLNGWGDILQRYPESFPGVALSLISKRNMDQIKGYRLSLLPLIKSTEEIPTEDLSLERGIAGYLILNY